MRSVSASEKRGAQARSAAQSGPQPRPRLCGRWPGGWWILPGLVLGILGWIGLIALIVHLL